MNAQGARRPHTMRLKKHHDVAHCLLFAPALANKGETFCTYPLDLGQERGTLVDNLQGALAECRHNPLGIFGTYSFDHATG